MRRIDTGEPGLTLGGRRGEDYWGRLSKYIPAEIVGLYLATSGVVPLEPDGAPKYLALWVIFFLNLALVPAYFIFATSRGKSRPLWPQVILASVAFPVWVFSLGGPFKCFAWYEGWMASITLMFVTVAFGFYRPPRGS